MPEETAAPMLVLGKSKTGQDILEPLCEVRHLLITGSSLSGNSPCMHAIYLCLLACWKLSMRYGQIKSWRPATSVGRAPKFGRVVWSCCISVARLGFIRSNAK